MRDTDLGYVATLGATTAGEEGQAEGVRRPTSASSWYKPRPTVSGHDWYRRGVGSSDSAGTNAWVCWYQRARRRRSTQVSQLVGPHLTILPGHVLCSSSAVLANTRTRTPPAPTPRLTYLPTLPHFLAKTDALALAQLQALCVCSGRCWPCSSRQRATSQRLSAAEAQQQAEEEAPPEQPPSRPRCSEWWSCCRTRASEAMSLWAAGPRRGRWCWGYLGRSAPGTESLRCAFVPGLPDAVRRAADGAAATCTPSLCSYAPPSSFLLGAARPGTAKRRASGQLRPRYYALSIGLYLPTPPILTAGRDRPTTPILTAVALSAVGACAAVEHVHEHRDVHEGDGVVCEGQLPPWHPDAHALHALCRAGSQPLRARGGPGELRTASWRGL
eukprot:3918279-Rhodomonas_salina.1